MQLFYYFMQMQTISVRAGLGTQVIKTNPIQTEAQNILNTLFQDSLGFFDRGMANRVEWFLPQRTKEMFVVNPTEEEIEKQLLVLAHKHTNSTFYSDEKIENVDYCLYISKYNKAELRYYITEFLKNV